jgi:hypothetical protein
MKSLVTALALGTVVIATMGSPAVARDGCGRGLYYNGYACVPEPYVREPYVRERQYYGPPRPYGGYTDSRVGCPHGWTVQDSRCKPYRGY